MKKSGGPGSVLKHETSSVNGDITVVPITDSTLALTVLKHMQAEVEHVIFTSTRVKACTLHNAVMTGHRLFLAFLG